ncbi:transglutaminase family protein [Gluconobacter japonicus]|uniref:transglutaminase family protein n=1 Tax=Gluconobacter japonicus TaxID=376620 RepID=UPI0007847DF3|nr:transglutaminase family protein [Gluconobacter japonicus]KXV27309.1 transglutaminase [Gluconobacter japonicus]
MNTPVMIRHHTSYRYDRPVFLGPQTIRLRPPARASNTVLAYALSVGPGENHLVWQQDQYANTVAEAVFGDRMSHFDIEVRMTVDLTPYDPLVALSSPFEETLPPYRQPIADTSVLEAFLAGAFSTSGDTDLDRLIWLNRRIAAALRYQPRMEPGIWAPAETLSRQTGSCRDSAWLLVALARHLGFAARFVSGYLIQPSAQANNQNALTCDLHAWAEILLPQNGWLGFDTTSGLITAQNHIPLAVSATPEDAAPVSGLLDHCQARFDVLMEAEHLHEVAKT